MSENTPVYRKISYNYGILYHISNETLTEVLGVHVFTLPTHLRYTEVTTKFDKYFTLQFQCHGHYIYS